MSSKTVTPIKSIHNQTKIKKKTLDISKDIENEKKEDDQKKTENSLLNVTVEENKDNGYQVSKQDIEEAFKFYSQNKKRLTPKDLKQRLKVFYPNMSNNEYKFLVSEPNFTVETLAKILQNNTLTNYDPVKEAFKVFDPKDTGYIDEELLADILMQLGYGKISSDDLKVLLETADEDEDGKISLQDFRQMAAKSLEETDASIDE